MLLVLTSMSQRQNTSVVGLNQILLKKMSVGYFHTSNHTSARSSLRGRNIRDIPGLIADPIETLTSNACGSNLELYVQHTNNRIVERQRIHINKTLL